MISIIDEPRLDIKKLDKEIKMYIALHGYNPKYLIMNDKTMRELEKSFHPFIITMPISIWSEDCSFSTYCGINIAICNNLKFGGIDIV